MALKQLLPSVGELMRESALFDELSFKTQHVNRILYLVVDMVFGVVLANALGRLDVIARFWTMLYTSIWNLEQLINWLTEYPAGLKLNDQLNDVLANFFKYHIHLWRTYISTLNVAWLPVAFTVLGVLGASVLIASFVDLIRVLTVHIFCFHVYASRLTQVCWYGIVALGRTFRGKKWNPLRKRVDSLEPDFRQLFIATLFFMVLLFLLPTVLVYFVVFSTIWLCVNSSQKALRWISRAFRRIKF
ncbi:Phosphatidylinositol N-acetylglucosaminyltransferase subunit Q [Aphelenchoides avenae]|nr:Phosphatidylinositol N-acetylglucosaminyltransferase subunit Q [Aphelenchus avenae]